MRYVEKRLADSTPPDVIGTPDILLMDSTDVVQFDSVKGKIHLITHANPENASAYQNAQARLDEMVGKMQRNIPAAVLTPE